MVVIIVAAQASGFKNNYSLMMYKTVLIGCGNHPQGMLTEGEGSVQLTSLNQLASFKTGNAHLIFWQNKPS
jgi:hypothetical protein